MLDNISDFTGWAMRAKEVGVDAMMDRVRSAVDRKLNPPPVENPFFIRPENPSEGYYSPYTRNGFFPDYVIVERTDGAFFKVPYSVENGQVVVSDQLIPVEMVWQEKQGA